MGTLAVTNDGIGYGSEKSVVVRAIVVDDSVPVVLDETAIELTTVLNVLGV